MAMTVTPEMVLRAQAKVTPGHPATSGDYTAGVAVTGHHAGTNVIWSSTVTLPNKAGIKFSPAAASYTKTGAATVTGGLLTQTDQDGNDLSGGFCPYTLGLQVTSYSAYAGDSAYACYFGTYEGSLADWVPTGGSANSLELALGPKNGIVMNSMGPNGISSTGWSLYNLAAQTVTVDIFAMGTS